MNLWNKKDLPLPPISTFKVLNKDIDIKTLRHVCIQLKDFLEDNKYLYAEYLVLSQIVYRMKQKFRSSKDFKSLEKLSKALKNFFNINLKADLETFLDLIPLSYRQETYLPTRNLLDFILVRLQGIVKLMERVSETCKISGFLFNERVSTGQFWKIAFILFSLVSRVYVLVRYVTQTICEFYIKLLPYRNKLKNSGVAWIPVGYSFPENLEQWAAIKWLDLKNDHEIHANTMDCIKMLKDDKQDIFNAVHKGDASEDSDEITEVIDIDDDNQDPNDDLIFVTTQNDNSVSKSNEVGEIIDTDNTDEEKDDDDFSIVSVHNLTKHKVDDDIGEVIPEDEIQNYINLTKDDLVVNSVNSNLSKTGKQKKRKKKHLTDKNDINLVQPVPVTKKSQKKEHKFNTKESKNIESMSHSIVQPKLFKKHKKKLINSSKNVFLSDRNDNKSSVLENIKLLPSTSNSNSKTNSDTVLKMAVQRKGELIHDKNQNISFKKTKQKKNLINTPKKSSILENISQLVPSTSNNSKSKTNGETVLEKAIKRQGELLRDKNLNTAFKKMKFDSTKILKKKPNKKNRNKRKRQFV